MACGPPPDVENAYLSGITGNVVHSVATYTCEEGYLPNGKMELKCNTDVQWTSDDLLPQCTGDNVKLIYNFNKTCVQWFL